MDWLRHELTRNFQNYRQLCVWLDAWLRTHDAGEVQARLFHYYETYYVEMLRQRRAVWCWHNSEVESAAMWSIYANAGIAVKTDVASLRDALPACDEFQIARVKYLQRNPSPASTFQWDPTDERDGLKLVIRPHLIKGAEYAHESEVRVSTYCLPPMNGWYVEGIKSRDLIKEVVVSPLVLYDEYVAVKGCLKAFAEKWKKKPKIRASALLGYLTEKEERAALARRFFPNHKEPDLPWPLKDL